ncbi:Utp20p ASCRUDRAFT_91567 [Ascoidea rubescens DSM 1968]|uniref:Uncharacterized protein n=1 Tax=Ascoidea rubescens DSM 1968 TaxID=1344418 RepID=A0A1D2VH68_9ASCO|nr:hypothetical protein ASCRUDRAFT_91567 [Ascoidea rubescens DSM 1968]ODV60827.1 hypothetical protein ASCRUDRAFT_91567 [Ascoidea rubescens DSM 1968]
MRIKAGTHKTTKSAKRFTFKSFAEQIDSINISSSLKLANNNHNRNYINTKENSSKDFSYYISTLEHWKEINLSNNFNEFLLKTDSFSQSLPQILHHKSIIFKALKHYLLKNDPNSLEALLDLLIQFIHDLNHEFLQFYKETIQLLAQLVEINLNPSSKDPNNNNQENSECIEWLFTSFAFIFKYLSKITTSNQSTNNQDDYFLMTFELLLPLLKASKKNYVIKFLSESLSFLIRKSSTDNLIQLINLSFTQTDSLLYNSNALIIMFTESVKNIKGSYHSNSLKLIPILLDHSLLKNPQNSNEVTIISDIFLQIINHGQKNNSSIIYEIILKELSNILKHNVTVNLLSIIKILISLVFSEGGIKIKSENWSSIKQIIDILIQKNNEINNEINNNIENDNNDFINHLSLLYAIIIKNSDIKFLIQYHNQIFNSMINLNHGDSFLPFVEISIEIAPERTISFGKKFIQDFILKNWLIDDVVKKTQRQKQIALFLNDLNDKSLISTDSKSISNSKISIIITSDFSKDLISNLKFENDGSNFKDEIYWRLLILKFVNQIDFSKTYFNIIIDLLNSITSNSSSIESFNKDIYGNILSFLSSQVLNDSQNSIILNLVIKDFDRLKESLVFINATLLFLSKNINEKNAQSFEILKENYKKIISSASKLLLFANHKLRYFGLSLIIKIFELLKIKPFSLLSQCSIIEEMPLNIDTIRDLTIRIRSLASDYSKFDVNFDENSQLVSSIIINYIFGLLTVKFQPVATAIGDNFSIFAKKNETELWNLVEFFLNYNFDNNNSQSEEQKEDNNNVNKQKLNYNMHSSDFKLKSHFEACIKFFIDYSYIDHSIVTYSKKQSGDSKFPEIIRSYIIRALMKVPDLAQKHSSFLVPFLLQKSDDFENEFKEKGLTDWPLSDINLLLKLFSKFSHIKNISKNQLVYSHLLSLLCSQNNKIRKLALECIINWKNQHINKSAENLRNLLDPTLFKDEIIKFIVKGDNSVIEEEDLVYVMPLILRILFGCSQNSKNSDSKQGRKFAVISILPNLEEKHIKDFLKLGYDKLPYEPMFNVQDAVINFYLENTSERLLRKMNGFTNVLFETIKTLGYSSQESLTTILKPLIFCLSYCQAAIDNKTCLTSNNLEKSARLTRQMGMKCLLSLFSIDLKSLQNYKDIIYQYIVQPRLEKFDTENLQQPSSLLNVLINWASNSDYYSFLYIDDFSPTKAILDLMLNENAKETVVLKCVEFCTSIISNVNLEDDHYIELTALVIDAVLNASETFAKLTNPDVNSKVINILYLIINGGYLTNDNLIKQIIHLLVENIDKSYRSIKVDDKIKIFESLTNLIAEFDCSFDDIAFLYKSVSRYFKVSRENAIREKLVSVMSMIGKKFLLFKEVSDLVADLNSFGTRLNEKDHLKRHSASELINEKLYQSFSAEQWLPLVYNALFFINDGEELSFRKDSCLTLCRFVDCFTNKNSSDKAEPYIQLLKKVILPDLRVGLRSSNILIQTEYILFFQHIIAHAKYLDDFADLKILLSEENEERNFFMNMTHIQLHRRQRALKRLREVSSNISAPNIAHYILPMIEHYAFSIDPNFNNITDDTIETIKVLSSCLAWNQYKALAKRYISYFKKRDDLFRNAIRVIIGISKSLLDSKRSRINGASLIIKNLPVKNDDIDNFVMHDMLPVMNKILIDREEEFVLLRVPIAEAMTSYILCLNDELITNEFPGFLTKVCHMLRSKYNDLRDVVRKSLSRMAHIMGAGYLNFLLKEMKTALARGSQIHVLSYTLHSLLISLKSNLKHGDLDESAYIISSIVMDDIFGDAGSEKDEENYKTQMKEVKARKSGDTAEMLTNNISLNAFKYVVEPIKRLLGETLSAKDQNKLDDLLKRYSAGLIHNEQSSTKDALLLCYELYYESSNNPFTEKRKAQQLLESEDHFIVNLDAKSQKLHLQESRYYSITLKRFSFEFLLSILKRNSSLVTAGNLAEFVPLLRNAVDSQDEKLIVSSLKVLNVIVKVNFSDKEIKNFKFIARKCLVLIKDSPLTSSNLCQACLRYLSAVIRNREEIQLKETAISYILVRLQPDLEEPERQSLAYNFLKAVVSKHLMVPEVYDTLDKVKQIMVTNPSKETRDVSRSIYFQFLMEYDQSRGRLESQFKFLVNNLSYKIPTGRESVMEIMHSIFLKADNNLIMRLSSSFFIGLSNVVCTDESSKCRAMASELIKEIFQTLGKNKLITIEDYMISWVTQSDNKLLLRCGLQVYKLYLETVGLHFNAKLDEVVMKKICQVFETDQINSVDTELDGFNSKNENWELIFVSLNIINTILENEKDSKVINNNVNNIWDSVVSLLLYPHSWVRLASSQIINKFLQRIDKFSDNYKIQNIGYRLIRSLGAPSIDENLGEELAKNITLIAKYWVENQTLYIKRAEEEDDDEETNQNGEIGNNGNNKNKKADRKTHNLSVEWLIYRISYILKKDYNFKKLVTSKIKSVGIFKFLIERLSVEQIIENNELILLPLYNLSEIEYEFEGVEDLKAATSECLTILEKRIGTSNFTKIYSGIKQIVEKRRKERKMKMQILAVSNPEIVAKRKLKKHERHRQKRKLDKDSSGLYRVKKMKVSK